MPSWPRPFGCRSSPEELQRLNAAFHEATSGVAGIGLLLRALRSLNPDHGREKSALHRMFRAWGVQSNGRSCRHHGGDQGR